MNPIGQTVQVTLSLPKETYEHIAQTAVHEQRRVEDLLNILLTEGLESHVSLRELFERISGQYRVRLASEHRLEQSPDKILQELRTLREQIADELYS